MAQHDDAFLWNSEGRCMVVAHGNKAPEDGPFLAAISHMHHVVSAEGSLRLLVYAAGNGGPNAKQRASFQRLGQLPIRAVLISDSAAMRALVTAAAWVMQQPLRAAATRDAPSALDFLELDVSERQVMGRMLRQVCADGGFPTPSC